MKNIYNNTLLYMPTNTLNSDSNRIVKNLREEILNEALDEIFTSVITLSEESTIETLRKCCKEIKDDNWCYNGKQKLDIEDKVRELTSYLKKTPKDKLDESYIEKKLNGIGFDLKHIRSSVGRILQNNKDKFHFKAILKKDFWHSLDNHLGNTQAGTIITAYLLRNILTPLANVLKNKDYTKAFNVHVNATIKDIFNLIDNKTLKRV